MAQIDVIELKGTVKALFKNCPKPDGWFGCFFKADRHRKDIKVTGVLPPSLLSIHKNQRLILFGQFESNDSFKALRVCKPGDTKVQKLMLRFPFLTPAVIDQIVNMICVDDVQMIFDLLAKNPYKFLLSDNSTSESLFSMADKMAIELNTPLELCVHETITFVISSALKAGGHMCLNLTDMAQYQLLWYRVEHLLGGRVTDDQLSYCFSQITQTTLSRGLVLERFEDQTFVYSERSYQTEKFIVSMLTAMKSQHSHVGCSAKTMMDLIEDYESKHKLSMDMGQKMAVAVSLKNKVSVITGGPGCGKTTVLACLVDLWNKTSNFPVYLMAPTGIASHRMTMSMASKGIHLTAKTIMHHIAKAKALSNKNDYDYHDALVIIDETSMVDMFQFRQMLYLIKDAQIVFVGDVNQLPSIGEGQFFKDLCQSQYFPVSRLEICYRLSRRNRYNAMQINDGQDFEMLLFDDSQFSFSEFFDEQLLQDELIRQYANHLENGIKQSRLCLLTPTNKGLLGVNALNRRFQDRLNPLNPAGMTGAKLRGQSTFGFTYSFDRKFYEYRVGDRVVQMKNMMLSCPLNMSNTLLKSGDLLVHNGDCGTIVEFVNRNKDVNNLILVAFDDGRKLYYNVEDAKELKLAYAMTIHKSQGSEYDAVMIVLPHNLSGVWAQGFDFMNRNLLYTAVTRSCNIVNLFGSQRTIEYCMKHQAKDRGSLLLPKFSENMIVSN